MTASTLKHELYPPSFLDRFLGWIKGFPIPFWLTYFLLFCLQSVLFHILSWIDGWIPAFQFNALILILPMWQWLTLAIVSHLNDVAQNALSIFRPLLETDDARFTDLVYEFTHMPNSRVVISVLFWATAYIPIALFTIGPLFEGYGMGKVFSVIVTIEGVVCYGIGGIIYYHSIRQLLLVNRTVKQVRHFDLFHLEPVYAFSRLTARTGISWMLLLSLTMILFPLRLAGIALLGIFSVQIVLAVAAFVLPLWFVHQRLVAETRKIINDHNLLVQSVIERLHHALEKNEKEDVSHFSNALTALGAEREVLNAIPTWPWRAGTVTGFVSAIILPIVLFLVQLAIQKMLGM